MFCSIVKKPHCQYAALPRLLNVGFNKAGHLQLPSKKRFLKKNTKQCQQRQCPVRVTFCSVRLNIKMISGHLPVAVELRWWSDIQAGKFRCWRGRNRSSSRGGRGLEMGVSRESSHTELHARLPGTSFTIKLLDARNVATRRNWTNHNLIKHTYDPVIH